MAKSSVTNVFLLMPVILRFIKWMYFDTDEIDSEIEKWFSVYDKCMYCFLPVILYIIYRKNIPSLYKRFPGMLTYKIA